MNDSFSGIGAAMMECDRIGMIGGGIGVSELHPSSIPVTNLVDGHDLIVGARVKRSSGETTPCSEGDDECQQDGEVAAKKVCRDEPTDISTVAAFSNMNVEVLSVPVVAKMDDTTEVAKNSYFVKRTIDPLTPYFDKLLQRQQIVEAMDDVVTKHARDYREANTTWGRLLEGDALLSSAGAFLWTGIRPNDFDQQMTRFKEISAGYLLYADVEQEDSDDDDDDDDDDDNSRRVLRGVPRQQVLVDQSFAARQQKIFFSALDMIAGLYGQKAKELEPVLAYCRVQRKDFDASPNDSVIAGCNRLYGVLNEKMHERHAMKYLFLKEAKQVLQIDAGRKIKYGDAFVEFLDRVMLVDLFPACDDWINAIERRLHLQSRMRLYDEKEKVPEKNKAEEVKKSAEKDDDDDTDVQENEEDELSSSDEDSESCDSNESTNDNDEVKRDIDFIIQLLERAMGDKVKKDDHWFKPEEIGPQVHLLDWIRVTPESFACTAIDFDHLQ